MTNLPPNTTISSGKRREIYTHKFGTGHVIDEYSVRANTIVCVCGWKGDADSDWKEHKVSMKAQPKVAPIESGFQKMHRKKPS